MLLCYQAYRLCIGCLSFQAEPVCIFYVCRWKLYSLPDTYGSSKRPFSFSWLIQLCLGIGSFPYSFSNWLLYLFYAQLYKGLPYELIEAARVEGVSEFKIFWYIVVPLMRPAMAALISINFYFHLE